MRIAATGNIGIGTAAPTQRLEVAGNLKISGVGNGLMFPDGSKQTTASTGGGGSMTGSQIVTAINDPATTGTINDNRLSPNVARLNTANTFNGNQTVNGDISTSGPTAMVNVAGGVVISCNDRFVQCFNVKNNTLTVQPASQRVGIGVADPPHKLSVAGTVQSTTGGFVFPDGSIQTSAAVQGFTKMESTDLEIAPLAAGRRTVISLDVPPGTYAVTASIQFENTANQLFQNNSRQVSCLYENEPGWLVRLGALGNEGDALPLTFTTVLTISGGVHPNVIFECGAQDGSVDRSYVLVKMRRITAIRLGDLVTQ
jgi:hypothetical protein